jgi:uncharacterized protein (DUF58 family)
MVQRFLNPEVLASISSLDLVAKTVVEGFISGLHRSPDFGFSQEFAEYRAYNPGDDLRHVDWNVYARSEKMYLKRYRGETNTLVTIMLDQSASMKFGSHSTNKLDYARYLAASLAYMASTQRDAIGLVVFDDEVRDYVHPSGRQGQLHRVLHAIGKADSGARTDFAKPFIHCMQFLSRRGLVVVISDFYEKPDRIMEALAPLGSRGNEVALFHILDPEEIAPKLNDSALLIDMETNATLEVTPEYARDEYVHKMDAHIETLKSKAQGANMDYCLLPTNRPLDAGLREYLAARKGRI